MISVYSVPECKSTIKPWCHEPRLLKYSPGLLIPLIMLDVLMIYALHVSDTPASYQCTYQGPKVLEVLGWTQTWIYLLIQSYFNCLYLFKTFLWSLTSAWNYSAWCLPIRTGEARQLKPESRMALSSWLPPMYVVAWYPHLVGCQAPQVTHWP